MFAVTDTMAAVCGRYSVHLHPITFVPMVELGPLDIATNLPPNSKISPNKLSLVGLDLSADSHYLVTADSGRNVYLFEFTPHTWDHVTSWVMEKRTSKVQFDRSGQHILITDKSGDVFVTTIGSPTASNSSENEVGQQVAISTPRKILQHSHHIVDLTFTKDNAKILTCSSDEMIRVYSYPTVVELINLGFKLAHKESVVNIALVNRDTHLLSISAEGTLKFWRVWFQLFDEHDITEDNSNPQGKSNRHLKSWNIFSVLDTPRAHANEIVKMTASTFEGRIYLAILISGFKQLPVFELKPMESTLRLFGQARLTHDFVDLSWNGKNLFVFNPLEATVNKYVVSRHGGLIKEEFSLRLSTTVKKDIAAFGVYNRPFFPAKKRVPSQILNTIAETKEVLLHEFGPLPSEEEKEAAEAEALIANEKTTEETPEQVHARLAQLTQELMKKKQMKSKVMEVEEAMTSIMEASSSFVASISLTAPGPDPSASATTAKDEEQQVEMPDDEIITTVDEFAPTQETESIQTDQILDLDDDNYEGLNLLDDDEQDLSVN